MNLVAGVLMIALVVFMIFVILVYQWIDKYRFSVERNYTKSKDVLIEWHKYVSEVFKDDEKIAPILEQFAKEKKIGKKVEKINAFQEEINKYCLGNDAKAAEYKKIRKASYDRLKEFAKVHNILADEYNEKLYKSISNITVKIFRMKEMPLIYLGSEVAFYRM